MCLFKSDGKNYTIILACIMTISVVDQLRLSVMNPVAGLRPDVRE